MKKGYRNDIERLKALISYNILDTPEEESFNNLAELVSIICNTPAAIISFIDDKRQWYKAKKGIPISEISYDQTACQYVIADGDILEMPDMTKDQRILSNPHIQKDSGVKFYIGVPLISDNGHTIGTICTFDDVSKTLSEEQKTALKIIANQVMHLLNVSKQNKALTQEVKGILEQKIEEAKESIKTTEAAYNTLFKAIEKSNAVIEFSPKGIIESVNDTFLEITGYDRKELLGQKHEILLNEKEIKTNYLFWESLNKGKFKSGRFKRKHKDGSVIWIQASYSPILNTNNEVVKVTKIAQNITTEINAQQALEKAKSLADELNIQKDHFIANMSHEIRTPINAVLGFTDLLLDEERDEKKLNYLKSVKTAGDNLLFLINDILDLSKIEAGLFQIDQNPFNLHDAIKNTFSILEISAKHKGLNFTYSIADNVPEYIIGDKNRLSQILINLLNNAIKFTPKGSVNLKVTLNDKSYLKFDIIDSGIGIAPDKLKTIFERFSQAEESTSKKYGGTGLGLNISKQLVEKQKGTITVQSELNIGTTFTFTLPFELATNVSSTKQNSKTSETIKDSVKILMCEDNEMNQNLMKSIFMKTNHKLDIAENGKKGIELLSQNSYDLILMDIQMPELDGYETTQLIRTNLKLDTPIIAITAYSTIKEKERCVAVGMNDSISKPFQKNELFSKINHWTLHETISPKDYSVEKEKTNDDLISLEYLKEMCGDDKTFLKEMLLLFVKQASENLILIQQEFKQNNLKAVKKIAHKLKSSFGVVGADTQFLDTIEEEAIKETNNENVKTICVALDKLEIQHKNLINEIENILNLL
ncbi:ATP-binding protein [Flavobacterium sp. H122]|uniref:ATP-binding protein n=1 Tax=Flavobacterium sp. H122 TaxID=2529860 RepID=UPI0010AB22FE|nr:ATP-binding protein [Flavobacterium sp. H122]